MPHQTSPPPHMMPDLATHADVGELYSLILGNPQANVDKAITTFVQEFETKRTFLTAKNDTTIPMLRDTPARLNSAKGSLDAAIDSTSRKATTTLERLQLLQQTIATSSEKMDRAANATQLAKEAFQKDITEAKEAFDQEMVLRHADVVKQYVGACMDLF
ncbi:hypothetical protein EDD21DRAFT_199517 [Dissophora ornata]|nr:hypothetical protein EDD21DRAFT_199517 [Dissophora ornata]